MTTLFRGYIAASSSYVYWSENETQPDGVSLITTTRESAFGPSITFSSSLSPLFTSNLIHNFDFTQNAKNPITNITDSVGGFVINGGAGVANGRQNFLPINTIDQLSAFDFNNLDNRKFTASGNAVLPITASMTIEAIVKHNQSLSSFWHFLVGNHETGSTPSSFRVYKQGSGAIDKIRFDFADSSSTSYVCISTSSLPLSTWTHLVITREVISSSTQLVTSSIYLNGTLDAQGKYNFSNLITQNEPNQRFYIGGNQYTTDGWGGQVLFVRIYNDSLSSNQVEQMYSSSIGTWGTILET